MSRISETFARGKVVIPFLPVGDPSLAKTSEYMMELDSAGADMIGLVLPSFSYQKEEDNGENPGAQDIRELRDVFEMCRMFRTKRKTPLVLMIFHERIRRYGEQDFFRDCGSHGVDGILTPDADGEQGERLCALAGDNEIAWIPVVPAKIREDCQPAAAKAEGFLYLTSAGNDEGGVDKENTELPEIIRRLCSATGLPAVIGFGIHTTDQATQAARISDGIVVGSVFANMIAQYGGHAAPHIYTYARMMKEAVRAAER